MVDEGMIRTWSELRFKGLGGFFWRIFVFWWFFGELGWDKVLIIYGTGKGFIG